jgi:hypothetical protein
MIPILVMAELLSKSHIEMHGRKRNRMMLPERRQHVRIVTLRNFGWLTLALAIAFIAISFRSELRGRHMNDYGRLTRHQYTPPDAEHRPVEVIEEGTASEPLQPAQEMVVVPVDQPPQMQMPEAVVTSQVMPAPADGSRVTIVGGPEGVTIVKQPRRRPQLSGGFGR